MGKVLVILSSVFAMSFLSITTAVSGGTKTDTLTLVGIPKSTILGITTAKEGMILFDSTDHQLVVYLNGNWYPITVGSPLSN